MIIQREPDILVSPDLPVGYRDGAIKGNVVSMGGWVRGQIVLNDGDEVLYPAHAGCEYNDGTTVYDIVRAIDILAVIK